MSANQRKIISSNSFIDERTYIETIENNILFDFRTNIEISKKSKFYIEKIRNSSEFGIEQFLNKYSLTSEEGLAIMCLTESLLRIPDEKTSIELLYDKFSKKSWGKYIVFARSRFLELSSIGLFALGKVVDIHTFDNSLTKLTKRFADIGMIYLIKSAISYLAKEFIIGNDINEGLRSARKKPEYLYSFDLLGESARTLKQSDKYYSDYINALDKLNFYFPSDGESLFDRPNLSVKLSALYPRVELLKEKDLDLYLFPKLVELVSIARDHNISISFDAEEAKRTDIYLYIVTKLILDEKFKNYNGIGIVVQAYQKRASSIIDYAINLSKKAKKIIPIRLVKGAYWDSEIKYAQENGLEDYPVFTKKIYTDANYISCARKIFENIDYIYPQFATHNAYTASVIMELGKDKQYEIQKLFGMGNSLHKEIVKNQKVRIYAPIGQMNDLLPYLMRRLLENGANTSFVNQIYNKKFTDKDLLMPIYEKLLEEKDSSRNIIAKPSEIYKGRKNSKGMDLGYIMDTEIIQNELAKYNNTIYKVGSLIDGKEIIAAKNSKDIFMPANSAEKVGEISYATSEELKNAVSVAKNYFEEWSKVSVQNRADIIKKIGESLEFNKFQIYSLLIREAGKSITDAINEVREAIDFCNYYSLQAEKIIKEVNLPGPTGEKNTLAWHPRGVFLCISPWNFPLAIFLGQIVAALVAGNTVIAKPADQTCLIANYITKLAYGAGLPREALQLVLASGKTIGEVLVPDDKINGIVFTGSTETAKRINLTIAQREGALIPLIAETGGQNAMIVDSSSLLEQVADDVIRSAFYSAGQRCSALRVLYIQEEIYDQLLELIIGSMQELKIGDTRDITNDIGPVIDVKSKESLEDHIKSMQEKGYRLIAQHDMHKSDSKGSFVYPHIFEINSINDLQEENFGPILHVCRYKSEDLDKIINEINQYGYGLTFGIQSRIDSKINEIAAKIKTGNIYINRSIIGAQVESHPFGGENKSGTGFKAGGPHYLMRFMTERSISLNLTAVGGNIELLSRGS